MLDNDIISPSNSEWASPLHIVTKKDGSFRPCGDYRRLNDVTVPDRYPIPRIEDFQHILANKTVFSKIDLFKAYFHIPVAEEDKPKTAIITPFGLYQFNVMSFGLKNAPATFQRFINEVFYGLDFVFPYLDDVLIASSCEEEHRLHLKTVFQRLDDYGLRINITKSVLGVPEIDFLGYRISAEGSKPLPEKVKAILDYPLPETIHDLRSFLGMLNFYRRYIKDAAYTQAPLHEFLKGAKKKDRRKVPWTDAARQNFEKCKQDIAQVALLTYPNSDYPLSLYTDASDLAIGSVLQQYENDGWKPIAFFSKKLNNAQKNYSTYDRELLGIYLSIKHFKHLLEGRDFTVFTDHKPLIFAFKQKNDKASPRQLRHLHYISQFTTNLCHIQGQDNIVADTLSRIANIDDSFIDYDQIADNQMNDNELNQLKFSTKSLYFKQHQLPSGKVLWCDTSTSNIRPFIPKNFRMQIFNKIHGLAHPGIRATVKEMTTRFVWPDIRKDVSQWARACLNCQKNKVTKHTKSEYAQFQAPDERFSIVHIDLIGPYSPSNGHTYCLTCIDRFTSWMEVIPLPNITAETVARAFYENWITRFGVPFSVITDKGQQFRSQLFRNLTLLCGVKLQSTTSYHAQSNGKIERLHRTLKSAIRCHNSLRWTESLPTVLMGLRAALHEDCKYTIAEMVYGKTIKLPGEFFEESKSLINPDIFINNLRSQMSILKPYTTKLKCKQHIFIPKDLHTCSHVFLRIDRVKKPLEPPYEGPYLVLQRTTKYFTVLIKNKQINISIDRLKPAYMLKTPDNDSISPTSQINPTLVPVNRETLKFTATPNDASSEHLKRSTNQTRCGRAVKLPVRFSDFIDYSSSN